MHNLANLYFLLMLLTQAPRIALVGFLGFPGCHFCGKSAARSIMTVLHTHSNGSDAAIENLLQWSIEGGWRNRFVGTKKTHTKLGLFLDGFGLTNLQPSL
jgi:hypothetical protein